MKLNVDGSDVIIKFWHGENNGRRVTACQRENHKTIYAICNPGDQFSKATGRKVALKKALVNTDRSIRTTIWNAYFKEIKRS